jgi:hypothetical protein
MELDQRLITGNLQMLLNTTRFGLRCILAIPFRHIVFLSACHFVNFILQLAVRLFQLVFCKVSIFEKPQK